jgi:hypothetical protein
MIYDLIVIGGGPAGIFGAIHAKNKGKKVLLLEKMEKIGKKLLLAGSGQCNLTHSGNYKEFLDKYGENGKFLKRALYKYPPSKLIDFFSERGLNLVCNEKGKYFPESMRALDVLNILKAELIGVDIILNTKVQKLTRKSDKFICVFDGNSFEGKNVLISTGGMSYGITGSTGEGYSLAKKLGHSIIELRPALTSCYVEDYPYEDLAGMSFKNAEISIYKEDGSFVNRRGDLLFTHKNLSGPLILDSSRFMKNGFKIEINYSIEDRKTFEENFRKNIAGMGGRYIKNLSIRENFPQRFLEKAIELASVPLDKKAAELSREEIGRLIMEFSQKSFVISKLEGYNSAMVTAGGINLNEINKDTMESKIIKGLYFAGEVMDIDGDTGGYNIQCAYSTGAMVGEII